MLMLSVVSITVVVLIGGYMVVTLYQGKTLPRRYGLVHAGFAGVGALLTIVAAVVSGDGRLWANIGLAVMVTVFGIVLGLRKLRQPARRVVLVLHATMAMICFLFLIYNTFVTL